MKHTLIKTVPGEAEAFSGCSQGPRPAATRAADAPPIFVNGVCIPESAIAREAQNHAASSGAEARATAARALVIKELLLQRARALGLKPAPKRDGAGREESEEEALVREVLELEAPATEPGECERRRVYDTWQNRFTEPETFAASHILYETEEQAHVAIDALHEGADFADLARRHSACPSSVHGGALGPLRRGDLAPEFELVLLSLGEGQVASKPVRTRHGWHVVRLDSRAPGRVLPYEAVADMIGASLRARAAAATSARYVARLAAAADIEGVSLTLGVPP